MDGKIHTDTPLKTNMSPENQWLEDVFPIKNSPFLGDMLAFWGVAIVISGHDMRLTKYTQQSIQTCLTHLQVLLSPE